MHRCEDCKRDLKNQHDLKGHLGSRKHTRSPLRRCVTCNKNFCDEQALNQHLDSPVHGVTQFRCCDCNRDFVNDVALLQHLRDKIHKPKPRAAAASKVNCDLCGKAFCNKSALKQHKASPVHKPLCAPLTCIGSRECNKVFASPSSMIHHLENGTCMSGLTRDKVNEIIISRDTNHLITSPKAIEVLEAMPQSPATPDDSWAVLTPSSSGLSAFESTDSWSHLLTTSAASCDGMDTPEVSISGSTSGFMGEESLGSICPSWFLCPLCPPTSNRFKTAQALEKHCMSPAHSPKIFHCPTMMLKGKGKKAAKTFSTISGVAMHVESGACHGGMKALEKVVNFANTRLQELGFQQIKLLKG